MSKCAPATPFGSSENEQSVASILERLPVGVSADSLLTSIVGACDDAIEISPNLVDEGFQAARFLTPSTN